MGQRASSWFVLQSVLRFSFAVFSSQTTMARIGIHTSVAGGLPRAAERAHELGCDAFQIFSSSPRQWRASAVTGAAAREMARLRRRYDLYPLAIHANYLINLASGEPRIRSASIAAFRGELERALALEAEYVIVHPGSARRGDRARALAAFIAGLEEAAHGLRLNGTRVLVENTAGSGGLLGGDLAEVAAVIRHADLPMACCLDTAHSYQAGFDLATARGLNAWIRRVEETVGWEAVRVVHTNDSRTPLGSRRDRHEHIGRGGIGREGFRRLLNHRQLRDMVFILETPIEKKEDDRRNLEAVRRLMRNNARKAI